MSIATIAKKLFRPAAAQVRPMCADDVPYVLAVERASFPSANAWGRRDFMRCFVLGDPHFGWIAEAAGQLIAFAVTENNRSIWIRNLAVLPEFRRRGVGRLMLESIKRAALKFEHGTLRAIVRERNLSAQLFFSACGWRAVGISPRPYDDCDEDGIRFLRRIKTGH